jgi:hypothetical protein
MKHYPGNESRGVFSRHRKVPVFSKDYGMRIILWQIFGLKIPLGRNGMFRLLETRIERTLMLFTCFFALLINIVAFSIIYAATHQDRVQLTLAHIRQQEQNVQLHMQLLEETSRLIAQNSLISQRLVDGDASGEVANILNDYLASSLYISGLSIYALNESIYSSRLATSLLSLEKIAMELKSRSLLGGEPVSFWMVQHLRLTRAPDGYLTYISGIYNDDGILLGYLAVDTDINRIFSLYQLNESKNFINEKAYIYTSEGEAFSNGLSSPPPESYKRAEGNFKIIGNHIVRIVQIPKSKDRVILSIPLAIFSQMLPAGIVMMLSTAAFIFISFILIAFLSKSVMSPLMELHQKMQSFMREKNKI